MPADAHVRAVALLHIILGALALCVMGLIALFFGVFVAVVQTDWPSVRLLAGLGAVVAVPLAVLAIAQVVAAVYLLRGNQAARVWVLVFGILNLLNVPLGTTVGVYTLWVLLREAPATESRPFSGTSGA